MPATRPWLRAESKPGSAAGIEAPGLWRHVFAHLPEPCFVIADLRIAAANEALARLAGRDAADFDSAPLGMLLAPADAVRVVEAAAKGVAEALCATLAAKTGPIPATVTAHAIPTGAAAVVLVRLRSMGAETAAERESRRKSDFLAGMGHELRTPLNAILGFSELIQAQAHGPAGDARYVDYASDINGSGRRLLALVEDLVDIAKIEAGRAALSHETLDVAELVGYAADQLPAKADVRVRAEVDPGLAVRGDHRRLSHALAYVFLHARKAAPEAESVALTARRETSSGEAVLAVGECHCADLPAEEIPGRAHASPAMAIARRLVELHGGAMQACGTGARMRLPAARAVRT